MLNGVARFDPTPWSSRASTRASEPARPSIRTGWRVRGTWNKPHTSGGAARPHSSAGRAAPRSRKRASTSSAAASASRRSSTGSSNEVRAGKTGFFRHVHVDAFAGRAVVSSVDAEHGTTLRARCPEQSDDPLITTVTYYKGPAAQKCSPSRGRRRGDDLWRASEATPASSRRPSNAAPPITRTRHPTELRRTGHAVVGRLRLVDYMNPQIR